MSRPLRLSLLLRARHRHRRAMTQPSMSRIVYKNRASALVWAGVSPAEPFWARPVLCLRVQTIAWGTVPLILGHIWQYNHTPLHRLWVHKINTGRSTQNQIVSILGEKI